MFNRKKEMSELRLDLKQKKITELITSMLESSAEVHNSPLSSEYFVLDKKRGINAIITESYVKISSDTYRYELPLSLNQSEKLINSIKEVIRDRSEMIKKKLFSDEMSMLENLRLTYGGKKEAGTLADKKEYEDLIEENDNNIDLILKTI